MVEEYVFQPERRHGYIVLPVFIVILTLAGLYGVYRASVAEIGPAFVGYLLPTLAAVIFVPLLAYRFYALRNGVYTLDRDGLRLRWGLRSEDIPIDRILWVHPPQELSGRVRLPGFRLPGALLGVRRLTGGRFGMRLPFHKRSAVPVDDPEEVEFLASDAGRLILVATVSRIYAISPANPDTFMLAFERCIEMGSLAPTTPRSVHPSFLLGRVWDARPARMLLITGLTLSLILLAWVAASIPGRSQVLLGARPGFAGDASPPVRLMLLPVINTGFFLIDFFIGLFFYRRRERQALAYLAWIGGAFTPLVFLVAVGFILAAG